MSGPDATDPRLRLAPPGGRARTWLLAFSVGLPMLIGTAMVTVPVLRGGQPLPRLVDSMPLNLAMILVGLALCCVILWRVMAYFMRRQSLSLSAGVLEVRSSFYRCRMPLAEMRLDQARVVDLDERTELRPTIKTSGFSIPGFHSGWFLLRNRRRTFLAIRDGRRNLWLPGHGRRDLLIEPVDPAALLAHLRERADALAAPPHRG